MKYSIRQEPDGTHTLLRYGEVAIPNGGRPNNCELEFWNKLQDAIDLLEEIRDRLDEGLETVAPEFEDEWQKHDKELIARIDAMAEECL